MLSFKRMTLQKLWVEQYSLKAMEEKEEEEEYGEEEAG